MRSLIPSVRIPAALALLLWGCMEDPPTLAGGGGSSETTNGVVMGEVHHLDGTAAIGVRVLLLPRDFLKDTLNAAKVIGALPKAGQKAEETTTDAAGRFVIDSIRPGDYHIEAAEGPGSGVLLQFSTGDRDTLDLGAQTLRPTGAVRGTVSSAAGAAYAPAGASPMPGNAFVQVYGLDRVVRVDPLTGGFRFTDLPEGTYTFRALGSSPLVDPRVVPGVAARSLDTTDLGDLKLGSFEGEDYRSWAHSLSIVLNTTSAGANVSGTVNGFPLLLRLNRGNFDFSQTDGRDIRFAGPGGAHLHYEIERWDPALQEAEVWVKLDTLYGNSNQNRITLHWGRPGAPDWSDGRSVFAADPAGFGGVWHLGEEAAGTGAASLYRDATASANHGDDLVTDASTEGIIGRGHGFALGDYIKTKPSQDLRPADRLMISAWFKGRGTGALGGDIVSLGDSYGLRINPDGNVRMFIYKVTPGGSTWVNHDTQGISVLDSSWHHVVGTYDGSSLKVYVDGVDRGSFKTSGKIPYILGPDLFIGRHGTQKREYDFTGHLDEVAVYNQVRTASWIKLCFESQRLNPTLAEFPPR